MFQKKVSLLIIFTIFVTILICCNNGSVDSVFYDGVQNEDIFHSYLIKDKNEHQVEELIFYKSINNDLLKAGIYQVKNSQFITLSDLEIDSNENYINWKISEYGEEKEKKSILYGLISNDKVNYVEIVIDYGEFLFKIPTRFYKYDNMNLFYLPFDDIFDNLYSNSINIFLVFYGEDKQIINKLILNY